MAVELNYRCPQCPDIPQGVTLSDTKMREVLDSGKEKITVKGLRCGHVWALPKEDVESLRAALSRSSLET